MSANTLNSHADNGFLIDRFPLHLAVVWEFYNRYREFESLPLRHGVPISRVLPSRSPK